MTIANTTLRNNYANRDRVAAIMDLAKAALEDGHAIEMRSSAQLCYDDACELMRDLWCGVHTVKTGNLVHAARSALKSLAYSVGVFSEKYHWGKAYLTLLESEG